MSKQHNLPSSPLILLLLIGLLVISTLLMLAYYFVRPGVELELEKKIIQKFESQNLLNTAISVKGRDVSISGVVLNKVDALNVEMILNSIEGIRQINNHLVLRNQSVE